MFTYWIGVIFPNYQLSNILAKAYMTLLLQALFLTHSLLAQVAVLICKVILPILSYFSFDYKFVRI